MGRRPAVVAQHDGFNQNAISTTVAAAATSNLRLAAMPGNVRLRSGEAGLPKPSVVHVSRIATVDRKRLGERIGTLSAARLQRVLEGVGLVFGLAVDAPGSVYASGRRRARYVIELVRAGVVLHGGGP